MKRIALSATILLVAFVTSQTASAQAVCTTCRPAPVIVAPRLVAGRLAEFGSPPVAYVPQVTYQPYRQTGVVFTQRRGFFGRWRGWYRAAPVYSPVQPEVKQ